MWKKALVLGLATGLIFFWDKIRAMPKMITESGGVLGLFQPAPDDEEQLAYKDELVGDVPLDESTVDVYTLPRNIKDLGLPAYVMVKEGEELLHTFRGGDLMRIDRVALYDKSVIFDGSAIGEGGEYVTGNYYIYYPKFKEQVVLLKSKPAA